MTSDNLVSPTGPTPVPAARRIPLLVIFALLCLGSVVFLAILGPYLTPSDPSKQDLLSAGLPSSSGHLLGTDSLGRDILSRLMTGARAGLIGPVVVALSAVVIAVCLSLWAGFRGGWVEVVVMRSVDMMFALPGLLVIIVAVGLFGGGYWLAVAMLTMLTFPGGTRVIHSAVISQRNLPYLEAAVTLGVPSRRIMFVHLLPNVLPTVIATILLDFVGALVALSSLSFLGLGSPPGAADWGRMLVENRVLLEQNPLSVISPALLLILTAFSATVIGDWVYNRLEERRNAGA